MRSVLIIIILNTMTCCHKPKQGIYLKEEIGNEISKICGPMQTPTCSTTNYPYNNSVEVKIDDSHRDRFKVGNSIWMKDNKAVSFDGVFNNSSPGSSNTSSVSYRGTIKSRSLVTGTFTFYTSGGSSNSGSFSHTTTGTFSLKKQQ